MQWGDAATTSTWKWIDTNDIDKYSYWSRNIEIWV